MYYPSLQALAPVMAAMSCLGLPERAVKPRPIHAAAIKVGRNELCPCGCGRKSKHHQRLEQR
jgi:hypothetical protein